uniref:hypothetical protein n=1 Tax=Phyllosticta yuccae TaxID=1151444 RepID=UPI00279D4083|nr:hypothetical protein QLP54_mgp09 [Phyllosticta yuccae]WGC90072.1 hypothetical protein [Phyllosticta yuccae]
MRCGNSTMSCSKSTFVPSYANRPSGLGIKESLLLNIAFQKEAENPDKPIVGLSARSFSYGKTHTSQTILTTALKLWGSLVGNRWIILLVVCNAWTTTEGEYTDCSGRTSKVREIVPKGVFRTLSLNTGLPKGSNSYRQRNNYSTCLSPNILKYGSGNAEWKGRVVASLLFRRSYVSGGDTESKPNVGSKLNKLAERSSSFPNQKIDRELYSLLCNPEMLIYAYENIKSKPGNMTPALSPETLDGISKEKLNNLSLSLKSEKFTFAPSRRIQIPKASGGTRPLSIASDKIVQEAMRLILEAIYEPLFKDCSHGFRPHRSCHTALKQVSQEFQPAQWVIEGDQAKFFDSISHHKLMQQIEDKIADRRFTSLIWKALRAGYFEFRVYKSNIIPQGSIVSPILANIFLDQLDNFVLSIKKDFDKGERSPRSKISRYYEYQILKARNEGNKKLMRELIAQRSNSPPIDFGSPEFKRLSYVRYADDWIIGIRGSKREALDILNKIREFSSSIELTFSDSKTKLTNLNSESVLFLGTSISRSNHSSFSKMGTERRLRRNKLGIRLEAPLDRIKKKLTSASFLKGGKSHPKFLWLHHEHDQIILLYNSVLRGFLNYYNFVHNYGRLVSYVEFILKQSCAKLLATKFNLNRMAPVYKKFGSSLTGPKGKSFFKPSYKMSNKLLTPPVHYIKKNPRLP